MDRTIVGSFPFGREETARELLRSPVVGDTLTAFPLPITWFIRAGASDFVLF
jgi:hypothetical protein